MKSLVAALLLALATGVCAQTADVPTPAFRAIDIYLDPLGAPLAAYQLDFAATNGTVKIVGIEGGDPAAFKQPPFYDPKAMQQDRVILAAFSTVDAAQLPSRRTRVATVHLQSTGPIVPGFALTLTAAADTDGKPIPVNSSFEERKKP